MALKAGLSILLFIVTYLLLVCVAIGLTIALGYAGMMLIAFKPMFLTIMIGIALMSAGVFTLIFLVKFVFSKHTTDRSNLVRITAAEQPEIFKMIDEVVLQVKTPFPKKVYLSGDINAAVFYNSSFWSMFFPVQKNLQIGLGLIHSVTTSELKAILAHEFGHFSQRSMKLGSFVYNVNQVIYNMLYDNEGYGAALSSWSGINSYFRITGEIAAKIIQAIQAVLRKVYEVVNVSYMSLSREMEFHADEVAANVTGSQPLITSLLRLNLADQALNGVLDYYNQRVEQGITQQNVYPLHLWMLNFLGAENNISIKNGLPLVTQDDISRFNKTKLVITDQWSSHPSTSERIEHLQKLQVPILSIDTAAAETCLHNKEELQQLFTSQMFQQVNYSTSPQVQSMAMFIEAYAQSYRQARYPKLYNGYYNNKFTGFELSGQDEILSTETDTTLLFEPEVLDRIFTLDALENDIAWVKQLSTGETGIKTFDYDGQRYALADSALLLANLEKELENLNAEIALHDKKITNTFLKLAEIKGKETYLRGLYQNYNEIYGAFKRRFLLHSEIVNGTSFIQHTTPFETIISNFLALNEAEKVLKSEMMVLLNDVHHEQQMTPDIKTNLLAYINNPHLYFNKPEYNDAALKVLFTALNNYEELLNATVIAAKRALLEFQVTLIEDKKVQAEEFNSHPLAAIAS